MVRCEFQAVILAAGRGSRMTDLTSGTPKCLLPVGGKPILCHTIRLLEETGFQDIMIVVLEDESNKIQQSLTRNNVKTNFELISLPSESEDWGTADSLRYLMTLDKIKTDVLLVSCDLFTNLRINKLLCTYRQHRASFAALFFLPVKCEPFQVPGLKSKYKPEKDIIGIDMETKRLMFLASASDFEENVFISRNILKHHPKLNLRTDLVDGHFYVISYKLVEYLASQTSFSTLKGEFLPHVVGKQHIKKNLGNDESSVVTETTKKSLFEFMKETKLEENITELSSYNDHDGDLNKAYHGNVLKCYAVIADHDEFGIRINSLQGLCQANRLLDTGAKIHFEMGCLLAVTNFRFLLTGNRTKIKSSERVLEVELKVLSFPVNDFSNLKLYTCTSTGEIKIKTDITGVRINSSAVIESNQVDSVSFVDGGCKIKEKTSVKSSVIGESCVINSTTRISNCILLRNVEVQEGCILDNCIVANDAKIGSGCELKNCLVGPSFFVPNGTKANSQVLTKSEGLMEI